MGPIGSGGGARDIGWRVQARILAGRHSGCVQLISGAQKVHQ